MAVSRQFGDRSQRLYDRDSLFRLPWPVIAGYKAVHDWMDHDWDVHAAWQVRDVWEAVIKFLATVAVADRFSAAHDDKPASTAAAILLKPQGLSLGDWVAVLRSAAHDPVPAGLFLPELPELVMRKRRGLLEFMTGGDGVVAWRNRRFGHGVLRAGREVFGEEASHWLTRLHELFDDCSELFGRFTLESDLPDGASHRWSHASPLAYYHEHASNTLGGALTVRLRVDGRREALELSPLLTVQKCAVCSQWAAFFMDRYELGKDRAWFLDFVTGHAHRNSPGRLADLAARAHASGGPPIDADVPPEPREPDPDLFRDFSAEFQPPTFVAEAIAGFMKAHDRGVIFVTGPAGVGKTWLSQGLDHSEMLPKVLGHAVHILHLSLHRRAAVEARAVLAELAGQARREKRWRVPPIGEPSTAEQFSGWLGELLRLNNEGELVVALDGWDELAGPDGERVASGTELVAPPLQVPDLLPAADRLPRGVYLVLTTRPEVKPAVQQAFERVGRAPEYRLQLSLDPDDPAGRAVQKTYAIAHLRKNRYDGRPLPEAWAEPIIDRADGRFLYVGHFCRALRLGVVNDHTDLPAPADYYPLFFAHLQDRVGIRLFESHYRPALVYIAAAGQCGLSQSNLAELGVDQRGLPTVLSDLADLLHAERSSDRPETTYRLGHDEIRSFFWESDAWSVHVRNAERKLVAGRYEEFKADPFSLNDTDPFDVYRFLFIHGPHCILPEYRAILSDVAFDPYYAAACIRLLERHAEMELRGTLVGASEITLQVLTCRTALLGCAGLSVRNLFERECELAPDRLNDTHPLLLHTVLTPNLKRQDETSYCSMIYMLLENEPGCHELYRLVAKSLLRASLVLLSQGRAADASKRLTEAQRLLTVSLEKMIAAPPDAQNTDAARFFEGNKRRGIWQWIKNRFNRRVKTRVRPGPLRTPGEKMVYFLGTWLNETRLDKRQSMIGQLMNAPVRKDSLAAALDCFGAVMSVLTLVGLVDKRFDEVAAEAAERVTFVRRFEALAYVPTAHLPLAIVHRLLADAYIACFRAEAASGRLDLRPAEFDSALAELAADGQSGDYLLKAYRCSRILVAARLLGQWDVVQGLAKLAEDFWSIPLQVRVEEAKIPLEVVASDFTYNTIGQCHLWAGTWHAYAGAQLGDPRGWQDFLENIGEGIQKLVSRDRKKGIHNPNETPGQRYLRAQADWLRCHDAQDELLTLVRELGVQEGMLQTNASANPS